MRTTLACDVDDAVFVHRVRIRMQQAYGDARRTESDQALERIGDIVFIKCGQDRAIGSHALAHFESKLAAHQNLWLPHEEVVHVRPALSPKLEQIAESG